MSAEDSKLKSKGHGGGEWNHTIMTEEGDTLPAVRDTTVISGKSHAKVSTRKGGGGGFLPLPLLSLSFSLCFPHHSSCFPFLSSSYSCTLILGRA